MIISYLYERSTSAIVLIPKIIIYIPVFPYEIIAFTTLSAVNNLTSKIIYADAPKSSEKL